MSFSVIIDVVADNKYLVHQPDLCINIAIVSISGLDHCHGSYYHLGHFYIAAYGH